MRGEISKVDTIVVDAATDFSLKAPEVLINGTTSSKAMAACVHQRVPIPLLVCRAASIRFRYQKMPWHEKQTRRAKRRNSAGGKVGLGKLVLPNRVTRDPSATLRPVCNARPGVDLTHVYDAAIPAQRRGNMSHDF
jgi:hypothetical protein